VGRERGVRWRIARLSHRGGSRVVVVGELRILNAERIVCEMEGRVWKRGSRTS
jgi:hypothetical protein